MIKRILCKLTGGHRFQGAPDTFIDKHEIVHYRHACIKCGKICEYCVPWINIWRIGGSIDWTDVSRTCGDSVKEIRHE